MKFRKERDTTHDDIPIIENNEEPTPEQKYGNSEERRKSVAKY